MALDLTTTLNIQFIDKIEQDEAMSKLSDLLKSADFIHGFNLDNEEWDE